MNVINLCPEIINFEFTNKNTNNNLLICNDLEILHKYDNIKKVCFIINDEKINIYNCTKIYLELSDYIAICNEKLYDTKLNMIFLVHKDYKDDISYIIAGYSSNICNINRILAFSHGKIIQSTVDKHTEIDNKNIYNATLKSFKTERNMYNHMYNIYRVLEEIDTEYCIKMRSDEYYVDMEEYIEIMKNEKKLITNNLFFTGKDYYISDHLFGCNTKDFKEMINNLKDILENKIKIDDRFLSHTEKVFGVAYLYNKYSMNDLIKNQREILCNNFYIYDCNRFKDYIICTNNSVVSTILVDKYGGRNKLIHKKERIYLSKDSGYKYNHLNKKVELLNIDSIKKSFMRITCIEDINF